MSALGDILKQRIALNGPMTVADFMAEALGHPTHGYYITRDPLGAAGDFTTAPEISQMFGEMIGLWLAECWRLSGQPAPFVLAELGPGRGTLMADILRAARMMPGFVEAADIHLVETSPALREKQRAALADHDVTWLEDVSALPDGPLLVIGNEFFDALPVHQLQRQAGSWHERLVGLDPADNSLHWALASEPSPRTALLDPTLREQAEDGAIAEICPWGRAIARSLGERIAGQGGVALFIDYGYGEPAAGDTLQAVGGHDYAEVLDQVGEVDLTTHVDFAALAAAFREAGCQVPGLLTQGDFLQRLGIGARARTLAAKAAPGQGEEIAAALHRLIDDAEMGSLFKVLAIGPVAVPLPGFDPA